MQKPAVALFGSVMSRAEQPITASLFVLHLIIIPVFALIEPPLALDPLGAISLDDKMPLALVDKKPRGMIGDKRHYLNWRRTTQQLCWAGLIGLPLFHPLFADRQTSANGSLRPVARCRNISSDNALADLSCHAVKQLQYALII